MIRIQAVPIEREEYENRRSAEIRAVRLCLDKMNIKGVLNHADSGAPFIENHPEMLISVTHSQKWAVVAVGEEPDPRFGIDVEMTNRSQLERIAKKFLAAEEIAIIGGSLEGLTKAWTIKEAVYKAVAKTGVNFVNDIRLMGSSFDRAIYIPERLEFRLSFAKLDKNNLFCIAIQGNNTEIETLFNS